MPNCFQLFRKDGNGEPVELTKVDEELCAHFDVPVHPEKWFRNWYNVIGFGLAMGRSFAQLRELYSECKNKNDEEYRDYIVPVIDHMELTYTSDAWASR